MGMDVYGKSGNYFRNNVWWWHPLWDYCLAVAPHIAGKVESGHYNDGDGLDGDDARALSEVLRNAVATGATAEYKRKYDEHLASLPREKCDLCDGTGIRTDKVGRSMGMPEKALDEATAIAVGRTHGWCNACNGEGQKDAWATNYPFSVENVGEFADFLSECDGFQIC